MTLLGVVVVSFLVFCLWYAVIDSGVWKLLIFAELLRWNILFIKWGFPKWWTLEYMRAVLFYLDCVGTEKGGKE